MNAKHKQHKAWKAQINASIEARSRASDAKHRVWKAQSREIEATSTPGDSNTGGRPTTNHLMMGRGLGACHLITLWSLLNTDPIRESNPYDVITVIKLNNLITFNQLSPYRGNFTIAKLSQVSS